MLNDKTENDDSTHQYWPEEGLFHPLLFIDYE